MTPESNLSANRESEAKPKTAIVLNGNARSVTHRLVTDIGKLLTTETLFVSRSLDQSRFIARQIVNGGFRIVLCGGGDGTFSRVVSDVMTLQPAWAPAFGALKLGTGNAIASALGSARTDARGLAAELKHVATADQRIALPLVRVEGQLTPFVGCGLDAMILQDYSKLKGMIPKGSLRSAFEGMFGYGCSIATRSIWRYLAQALPEIEIRNEGAPATRIDLNGQPVGRPIPRGGLIYRGRASMAAAATIPFCGFGMRLYPQAGLRADRFQLRVGQATTRELLTRLPKVYSGGFQSINLYDFYCSAVSMNAPRPTAFQIGGDLLGSRTNVHLSLDQVEGVPGSTGKTALPPVASPELPAQQLRHATGH